jgi:hypothetical protein
VRALAHPGWRRLRREAVGDAGGPTDAPAADVPTATADTGSTGAYSCERFCRRLRDFRMCAQAADGCAMSMCPADFGNFPPMCDMQFRALFNCIERPGLTPTCTAGTFPYLECMELNGMARQCVHPGG